MDSNHFSTSKAQISVESIETDPPGIHSLAMYIPLSALTLIYWPGSHTRIRYLQNSFNYGVDMSTVKFMQKILPKCVILRPFQIVLLCVDALVHLS